MYEYIDCFESVNWDDKCWILVITIWINNNKKIMNTHLLNQE